MIRWVSIFCFVLQSITPIWAQTATARESLPSDLGEMPRTDLTIDKEAMVRLDHAKPGDKFTFINSDGKSYEARFRGKTKSYGLNYYMVDQPKPVVAPSDDASIGGEEMGTEPPVENMDPNGALSDSIASDSAMAGLNAGLTNLAVVGIYNMFIMTPAREADMKAVSNRMGMAQSAAQASTNEMQQTYVAAFKQMSQSLNRMNSQLQSPPLAIPQTAVDFQVQADLPGFATSDPEFINQAQPLWDKFHNFVPVNSTQQEAKSIGQTSLKAAGDSWAAGEKDVAEAQIGIAETMADLLVGLDPVTGTVRSGYELFCGKNMITGKQLRSWERGLAGTLFVTNLVTLGMASSTAAAIKASVGVVERMALSEMGKGLQAILAARKISSELKALKWTQNEIRDFAQFQRQVLRGRVPNLEYAVQVYGNVTGKIKSALPTGELLKYVERFGEQPEKMGHLMASLAPENNVMTKLERAIMKHPGIAGFASGEELQNVLRTPEARNTAAASALGNILESGKAQEEFFERGKVLVDAYRLPNGKGAWFMKDGSFIGFLD